jgi:hypothetical protein
MLPENGAYPVNRRTFRLDARPIQGSDRSKFQRHYQKNQDSRLYSRLSSIAHADPSATFPHPGRVRYDSKCVQIEGTDVFLYGGAFLFFHTPRELWRYRFQKIKDAGFNMVETYVPWNYHEREAPSGPGDFSKVDLSELEAWMDMAEEFDHHIIIRPGPYIRAEWTGGGPKPKWARMRLPTRY